MSDMSAQVRRALDVAVEAIGGSARDGQIEMAEAVYYLILITKQKNLSILF